MEEPTIKRGVIIALVRGLCFFAGTVVAAKLLFGEDGNPFDGSNKSLAFIALLLTVDAVGVSLALWKIGKQNPRSLGWHLDHVVRDIVVGVGGFAVCAGILAGVMYAVGGMPAIDEVTGTIEGYSMRQRLAFFAIGVFGASVAEESLYRGYLQPAMVKRLGPAGGIFLTSLLFSLFHFNFNPISIVSKLMLGATYGVVARQTRSLLAAAVTHALVWWIIGAA